MISSSDRIVAKATTRDDQSDAIVVSFAADWYEPLKHRKFSAVIRKRVPKSLSPRWMFLHINAPVSAICACAEIIKIESISLDQAIVTSDELHMPADKIKQYVGAERAIDCYKLGQIYFPGHNLSINEISVHMIYHPPQSFFVLSERAKNLLQELAGFFS